jgi:hypothetical protein
MISNPDVARHVSELMIGIYRQVEVSLDNVKEHASPEEFAADHKSLKNLLCGIVMDVLDPPYKKHPDLKPAGWDNS